MLTIPNVKAGRRIGRNLNIVDRRNHNSERMLDMCADIIQSPHILF